MFKKIMNYVLGISVLIFLYYGYKIFFDQPKDTLKLAELNIHMAYSALFMAASAFIRSHLK